MLLRALLRSFDLPVAVSRESLGLDDAVMQTRE